MKTGDIKNTKIAKKYSNALLETAKEENKYDTIYNDILFAAETVNTNKDLSDFLLNPIIKAEDKKDVIKKIFSFHTDKTTLNFLCLLVEKGRINALNEIVNQYTQSYNKINNTIKPLITSAVELSSSQKERLTEKLTNKLMKKVLPEYIINPDIIGGLIVEIGDKTIDFSIKNRFDDMKKQLTKGNRYGNN